MAIVLPSTAAMQTGSYVVSGPARTDAIGDILRASFCPKADAADDFKRLLERLDRQTPSS